MATAMMLFHNRNKENRAIEKKGMNLIQQYAILPTLRMLTSLAFYMPVLSDVLLFLLLRPLFVQQNQTHTNSKKVLQRLTDPLMLSRC